MEGCIEKGNGGRFFDSLLICLSIDHLLPPAEEVCPIGLVWTLAQDCLEQLFLHPQILIPAAQKVRTALEMKKLGYPAETAAVVLEVPIETVTAIQLFLHPQILIPAAQKVQQLPDVGSGCIGG